MKYAKIAVNLPIDATFDYFLPKEFLSNIQIGSRVWVDFRNKKTLGFVAGISDKTKIPKVKPVLELIDNVPVLNKSLLKLAKKISDYYCCSLGEAMYSVLSDPLRDGRKILTTQNRPSKNKAGFSVGLIHELSPRSSKLILKSKIKEAISADRQVLILYPETSDAIDAQRGLKKKFPNQVIFLDNNLPKKDFLKLLLLIKEAKAKIIIGLMSGIFAPCENLGLIIVHSEESGLYKQQQNPFYNSRDLAIMRAKIEGARTILVSQVPSVESYKEFHTKNLIITGQRTDKPTIKIIDLHREIAKRRPLISTFLENSIRQALSEKQKVALFLNRKGFALLCRCKSCGHVLRCPRCNSNLMYEFAQKRLVCKLCNYKTELIELCPNCKKHYINYLIPGAEKLESELHRLFPGVKIKTYDSKTGPSIISNLDILILNRPISQDELIGKFHLLGIISADTLLNRIDYRSSERTFSFLTNLVNLRANNTVIQTYLPDHYCIKAIADSNSGYFYKQELSTRRQLGFPPYRHLIQIILRSKEEVNLKKKIDALFKQLSESFLKNKTVEIFPPSRAIPPKLRDKYRWQILIKTTRVEKTNHILKNLLKSFWRSGIIVSVNVDP